MASPAPTAQATAARERIVEAALELFAQAGFAGASTREVALRAGVQQGLIGYHFGSKDGLWRAVVDAGFARLAARLHAAPGAAVGGAGPQPMSTASATERLNTPCAAWRPARVRARLRAALACASREPRLLRLIAHEALCPGPRLHFLVQQHGDPLRRALHAELAQLAGFDAVRRQALERRLVGWLASQVAFAALHDASGQRVAGAAVQDGRFDHALDAWLDAELDAPLAPAGPWSVAAARHRASRGGQTVAAAPEQEAP
jgi:AcrR family transcriptional regulator